MSGRAFKTLEYQVRPPSGGSDRRVKIDRNTPRQWNMFTKEDLSADAEMWRNAELRCSRHREVMRRVGMLRSLSRFLTAAAQSRQAVSYLPEDASEEDVSKHNRTIEATVKALLDTLYNPVWFTDIKCCTGNEHKPLSPAFVRMAKTTSTLLGILRDRGDSEFSLPGGQLEPGQSGYGTRVARVRDNCVELKECMDEAIRRFEELNPCLTANTGIESLHSSNTGSGPSVQN